MSFEFLKCQETFQCGTTMLPVDGYAFAPFIELILQTQNEIITVGNKSRPPNHSAVIKSMEYGSSEGMGVSIEIFDEQGGNFTKSMESINKSLGSAAKDIQALRLDFGWIVQNKCTIDAPEKISVKSKTGDYIHLLPINLMVVYEGGKIKYTLEAQDLCSRVADVRMECNIGRDDAKVPLKQAIRTFMKQYQPPPFFDVEFWPAAAAGRADYTGPEWVFKESDGGKEGPKGVWSTNQQNKLATLRRWIAPLTTSNGKGIILQWKGKNVTNTNEGGTIILQEDPTDKCASFDPCKSLNSISSVGVWPKTYIVNGGKYSPVLSFNPQVKWTFSGQGKSGGSQSAASGAGAKPKGNDCDGKVEVEKAGTSTKTTGGNQTSHWRSYDQESSKGLKANAAHESANAFREALSPIEAELKIIGDPSMIFPIDLFAKTVSLIVVNPFHIKGNKRFGDVKNDWLSSPMCNPVFSNKAWRISGVNHQIKEGSYVTILKLNLDAPNQQLPPGSSLGGDQSGGMKLPYEVNSNDGCLKK